MIGLWSKRGAKAPQAKPLVVPRPWDRPPAERAALSRGEEPEKPKRRMATGEELAAFFKGSGASVTVGRGNEEKG